MAGLSTVLKMAMKAAPKAAPKAMPRPVQQARPTEVIEDISETVSESMPISKTDAELLSTISNIEKLKKYKDEWKKIPGNTIPKSQRQQQTPTLEKAMEKFYQGDLDEEALENIINAELPIKPITLENFPTVATYDNMIGSLRTNQIKEGLIEDGSQRTFTKEVDPQDLGNIRVATRLDIPSYNEHNQWIVTLHEGGKKGKALGYGKTAVLKDVTFHTDPKLALNIARGRRNRKGEKQPKSTFARMDGFWKNHNSEEIVEKAKQLLSDPESGWIQVGMNPYRHSYFYDKATMQPLMAAEEVIQVGPLVLARGARKPTALEMDKYFTITTAKDTKRKFKKGGIVARNPYPEARGIY